MKKTDKTGGFKQAAVKIMRRYIYPSCLIFTVSVFLFSSIASVIQQSSVVPTIGFLFMLLVFSLYMTIINRIFYTNLTSVIKGTLHFIAAIAGFSIVFVLLSGYYKNGRTALFIIFIASLVYAVFFAATMVIRGIIGKKANEEKEYDNLF